MNLNWLLNSFVAWLQSWPGLRGLGWRCLVGSRESGLINWALGYSEWQKHPDHKKLELISSVGSEKLEIKTSLYSLIVSFSQRTQEQSCWIRAFLTVRKQEFNVNEVGVRAQFPCYLWSMVNVSNHCLKICPRYRSGKLHALMLRILLENWNL